MDTILVGLTVLGLAAGMGASLCYSVYHALTHTLPNLIMAHRQDLAEQRERYHQLLHTEHETFRESLSAIEAQSQESAARVCAALVEVQRQLAEQSRQMVALTAAIQRCHAGQEHRHGGGE